MQNKKKKTKKQSKIRVSDLKPKKDAQGGLKYGIQGPSRPDSGDTKHQPL